MSYGRSKFYDAAPVAELGDVAAAAVSAKGSLRRAAEAPGCDPETSREIQTLRCINAHLVRQIAVLRQREAHALQLADRDGLTGLFNRRRLLELLEMTLADAARLGEQVGLLFIDLDGFKGVNDQLGHAAGDELLTMVASRLAARARTADFVCRYGGDEFVMILPRVAGLTAVKRVADSIRARVAVPYRVNEVELRMTAAVGVSVYPTHAATALELLNRADSSMYRAKGRAADGGVRSIRLAAPTRRRDDFAKGLADS